MDIFSPIVHFLTDKTRKLSSKAILVILVVALIFLLDNLFSFSYYYNSSQKINQLNQISSVIQDKSLSDKERNKVLTIRSEILEHKTLKDYTYNYLTNLNFETSQNETNEIENDGEITNLALEHKRNPTIHFLTSAWWILITAGIFILMFPFVLLTDRKQLGAMIGGFIVLGGISYLFALFLSKVFSFIPLIYGEPIYNYVLNVVLSSLILVSSIFYGRKSKKTIANNG